MLIVCILLALLCAGLAFWVWAQRRSLREAAYRLRALEDTGSTARVRLAVPNSAAEELMDEVNRLLDLRQADRAAYQARERALRQQIPDLHPGLSPASGGPRTDGGGAAGIPGGDCGAGQDAPEPDYQLL